MRVYKDKECLIFDLDDGKQCKYNFSTFTAYGKKGREVKDLKSQLHGITVREMCESCDDEKYGRFLKFVSDYGSDNYCTLENIGTVLSRVPRFSNYEQIFSAGIQHVSRPLNYSINEIPKGLIKLCKKHDITLSNDVVASYKSNPDAWNYALSLEYTSLTSQHVRQILISSRNGRYDNNNQRVYDVSFIMERYGYAIKPLMNYIDELYTFEAIEDINYIMMEILDYCRMMYAISRKFDRYPRHFLSTLKIASRNYNRLKVQYDEESFAECISPLMECTIDNYVFIYPKTTQEIKDEAVQQNNCVSSYIKRVIDRECDILFMRNKSNPEKSLVTIEVVNGKIVQAKRRFNYPVSDEEMTAIKKWNNRFKSIMENSEILKTA